jgi:ESF2/ABP1 family protein
LFVFRVEFAEKKIAKRVCLMLNNSPMGGRKRNYYHDDIWNMKYLSGFKWNHLTEKISYEKLIKETKIRQEMTQAK